MLRQGLSFDFFRSADSFSRWLRTVVVLLFQRGGASNIDKALGMSTIASPTTFKPLLRFRGLPRLLCTSGAARQSPCVDTIGPGLPLARHALSIGQIKLTHRIFPLARLCSVPRRRGRVDVCDQLEQGQRGPQVRNPRFLLPTSIHPSRWATHIPIGWGPPWGGGESARPTLCARRGGSKSRLNSSRSPTRTTCRLRGYVVFLSFPAPLVPNRSDTRSLFPSATRHL